MGDRRRERRGAPKRTLIGPLVMLAGGVLTSAMVWRLLMLGPAPRAADPEFSPRDQQALERVLAEHPAP